MNKTKKKPDNYNTDILTELKAKYGFTISYIQKSIRGERTGKIPTQIQLEYKQLDRASKAAIKNELNDLQP
ncbi:MULTISPECIES: hypothetical protein [Sphingobacterium]|uniref:hypothetical protein n=1 Tax=Sphingobacterium TaxID=28453 RepID=UPI00257E0717|nr:MULTISPECIES: hypothetical protein [Sphingobacterium]